MTRRKFMKICLAAAGLAAAGGWISRSWAGGIFDRSGAPGGAAGAPQGRGVPAVQNGYTPRYLELEASGELERRERLLWAKMESCDLCPRKCRVNRLAGMAGFCRVTDSFRVASVGPHFGNERALIGSNGTGNIFLSNCNLLCIFCQNWEIAHRGDGRETTPAALSNMMISLQQRGCHNINFVTPTHLIPHLVTALRLAIAAGLNVPLLYNTSGYETLEVIRLLDGVVDIYLPDFKFMDSSVAARFLQGAPDYAGYTAAAIKEMHRQVGTLNIVDGIANRGLLVRHLVLPENTAGTDRFVRWVVSELGAETHVNIMNQFWPAFQARNFPPLHRRLLREEFDQATRWAREAGLSNFH